MAFVNALFNLWPSGDKHIAGLRDGIAKAAPTVFPKYGIDSPSLICHVMAQVSHECGAGTEVEENLNYSAQRMCQMWPSRFPTIVSAIPYAHNPRLLANKVYNGRMSNVPNSNDGWNYRGRGATQTTGRAGYRLLGSKIGIDLLLRPDAVNDPSCFLEAGVADFILCDCLRWAQQDNISMVTLKLNGGHIGLSERVAWYHRWKVALAS